MSDDRLMVPADLVSKSEVTLRYKFPLLLVVGPLKNAGRFLDVATNASARDVDVHTKIQDILFDLVKICDGFLLVSTSIKTGAKDIVEALGIAYLYLVDGFPDMAFPKIDSLQTTMEGMRKRVDSVTATLSQTKIKLQQARTITRQPQEQVTRNFELRLQTLNAAKNQLDLIEDYCRDLSPEVDRWLQECREVAQPQMARNRQDAERLSKGDQKKYWKELMNQPDVKLYLARWRALSQLCEEYQPTLKRTRETIDSYYTNNPLPNEAISLAWKDAAELPIADARWKALLAGQDLRRHVEPVSPVDLPEQINPVDIWVDQVTPDQDREQSIEVTLRRSEGSVSKPKAVTSALSALMESISLHGYESLVCGIFCGEKRNTHKRRIRNVQNCVSRVTGKRPMEKKENKTKQAKSPPFHGFLEHLKKDFGIHVSPELKSDLQTSARDYIRVSQKDLENLEVKHVEQALNKLNGSLQDLLKAMDQTLLKLKRDLGDNPKHTTVEWEDDKPKMKIIAETLSEGREVVESWITQVKKCTELLKRVETRKKEKGSLSDVNMALYESCDLLAKMLCEEKPVDREQQPKTPTAACSNNLNGNAEGRTCPTEECESDKPFSSKDFDSNTSIQ